MNKKLNKVERERARQIEAEIRAELQKPGYRRALKKKVGEMLQREIPKLIEEKRKNVN